MLQVQAPLKPHQQVFLEQIGNGLSGVLFLGPSSTLLPGMWMLWLQLYQPIIWIMKSTLGKTKLHVRRTWILNSCVETWPWTAYYLFARERNKLLSCLCQWYLWILYYRPLILPYLAQKLKEIISFTSRYACQQVMFVSETLFLYSYTNKIIILHLIILFLSSFSQHPWRSICIYLPQKKQTVQSQKSLVITEN